MRTRRRTDASWPTLATTMPTSQMWGKDETTMGTRGWTEEDRRGPGGCGEIEGNWGLRGSCSGEARRHKNVNEEIFISKERARERLHVFICSVRVCSCRHITKPPVLKL